MAELALFGGTRRTAPIGPPKIWRRLFHVFAGSAIPIAGIFSPETPFLWGLAVFGLGSLAVDLLRFQAGWLNRLFMRWLAPLVKADESEHITGSTYMVLAALLVFGLYGKEVGVPAMFFLSLGDPVAALVGSRVPGPRFRGKSPLGTAAFVGVGCAAAGVVFAAGGLEHHWAIWVGALVAGLVELASVAPDDNFTIPVLAGTAMHFLGA